MPLGSPPLAPAPLSAASPCAHPPPPPFCRCSDRAARELETWGALEARSYYSGAHLSYPLLVNVSSLLVQDLLRLEEGAQLAFCAAPARGCSGDDEERLRAYLWDLRADALLRPGEYSLWVQDVVRGRDFRQWSALWAFGPTVSLALIQLYGGGVRIHYSLLANLLAPYWPFCATAWREFLDTNPVWTLFFCAACSLANLINVVFLLQAARDKWQRIPFLLAVEAFTMLLVWLAWRALALVLPEAALAVLSRLALLAVPVIRYQTVVPFQGGEYGWLQEISSPTLSVGKPRRK